MNKTIPEDIQYNSKTTAFLSILEKASCEVDLVRKLEKDLINKINTKANIVYRCSLGVFLSILKRLMPV